MNILLCTDKSKSALAAISMGGRLAAALQADVTLVAAGKKEDQTSAALDAAQNALQAFGVVPEAHVRIGQPVEEFIREIRANCYDLAVIGYRRRSALEKAWSGCVAARVAHQSPASVLIVREGRSDISKILVGIGGNGFTRQMTEWAARLGSALGATVTLLHVDTAPPPDVCRAGRSASDPGGTTGNRHPGRQGVAVGSRHPGQSRPGGRHQNWPMGWRNVNCCGPPRKGITI